MDTTRETAAATAAKRARIVKLLAALGVVALIFCPVAIRILVVGLWLYFGPRLTMWSLSARTAAVQAEVLADLQAARAEAVADGTATHATAPDGWLPLALPPIPLVEQPAAAADPTPYDWPETDPRHPRYGTSRPSPGRVW